ncbi:MAG: DUF975 family protein [Clostridia bacterium]|nr:DUF975 family protein [Clostridia bacterium]
MFPKISAVKKTATALLSGIWPKAIAAVIIPFAFLLILLNVTALLEGVFVTPNIILFLRIALLFALVFLGFPLFLGVIRFFWGISAGSQLNLSEVFYYYNSKQNIVNSLNFTVVLLGRLSVEFIVAIIPSVVLEYISNSAGTLFQDSTAPIWLSNVWIFAVILRVLAIVFIIFVSLKYYLAPFLFVSGNNLNCLEILEKSRAISKYSISYFWLLFLGLLGWILLSIFVVPLIFTLPYFLMCYVVHSRYSVVFYNQKIKKD